MKYVVLLNYLLVYPPVGVAMGDSKQGDNSPLEPVSRVKLTVPAHVPDDLAARLKQFRNLKVISVADSGFRAGHPRSCTIFRISSTLRPEDALRFCRSFDLGSPDWKDAFDGLDEHPKHLVLPYLQQVFHRNNAWVLAICYDFCAAQEWPELVKFARLDKGRKEWLPRKWRVGQITYGNTLGETAQLYLSVFEGPTK